MLWFLSSRRISANASAAAARVRGPDGRAPHSGRRIPFRFRRLNNRAASMKASFSRSLSRGSHFFLGATSCRPALRRKRPPHPPDRAFPGAEGVGSGFSASGGSGGSRVIKADRSSSSGPGSLAEACTAEGTADRWSLRSAASSAATCASPSRTSRSRDRPPRRRRSRSRESSSSYDHGVHDAVIIRHLQHPPATAVGAGRRRHPTRRCRGRRSRAPINITLDHLSLELGRNVTRSSTCTSATT